MNALDDQDVTKKTVPAMIEDANHLSDNERAALIEVKRRIISLYPGARLVLFGSKARGDFREGSDIDLLVITERVLSWREVDRIITEVYEVNLAFGTLLTVHTAARDDWEKGLLGSLPFKREVENDGVSV